MARGQSPAGDEWVTLTDESAAVIIMDEVGDQFVGVYAGEEHVEPANGAPFDRYLFRDEEGTLYAMNKAFKLSALDHVKEGSRVRITLIKLIALKDETKNPMKDFRVEVAR